jgi:hypothetical protein
MTEPDWLASTDPQAMLGFLGRGPGISERKLRLFAAACCRRVWHLLTDERSREAVVVAERYADGLATSKEMELINGKALQAYYDTLDVAYASGLSYAAHAVYKAAGSGGSLCKAAMYSVDAACGPRASSQRTMEEVLQTDLVRCLFGNPFRPPPRPEPAWLTPRVLSLAQGIYNRRAFDHFPELASLLEDAGCHDEELLGHLRGLGPHARGCQVLDLLLGRV